eukprot:2847761-Prymnesium_polylepis.1
MNRAMQRMPLPHISGCRGCAVGRYESAIEATRLPRTRSAQAEEWCSGVHAEAIVRHTHLRTIRVVDAHA